MSLLLLMDTPITRGFSPDDIAGLEVWYEADAGVYTDAAALFDAGSSQYLTHASNSSLQTGDIDFSFAFWLYDTQGGGTAGAKRGATGEWTVPYNGARMFFFVNAGGYQAVTSQPLSHVTNVWEHWVCVHIAATKTLNLYKDGTLNATNTYTGTITAGTDPFFLGAEGSPVSSFVTGRMNAAGFWKRALDASDVTSLYNGGDGRNYASLTPALLTNLISYWNLAEGSGTRYDSHGANNLTEVNGVSVADGIVSGPASSHEIVTLWEDQGSNGYDAAQTTLSLCPTYIANQQNNLPAIRFDASDDVLKAVATDLDYPYTMFIAAKPNNTNGYLFDGTPYDAGGISFSGADARFAIYHGQFCTTTYAQDTLAVFTAVAGMTDSTLQIGNDIPATAAVHGGTLVSPWQAGGLEGPTGFGLGGDGVLEVHP